MSSRKSKAVKSKTTAAEVPATPPRPIPQAAIWGILASLILIGIVLRANHLGDVGTRSPDEKVYTYFARKIAADGIRATRSLFAEYEHAPQMWDYPVPARITYVLLAGSVMKARNIGDESACVAVSFAFSVLSLLLLAWTGLRFFNRWIALLAVLFLATSLCELSMARRAWLDATFAFFGLLLMYTACEITRNPRRLAWYPAFCALGTICLLTKQTGIVAYGSCALWLMWVLLVKDRSLKYVAVLAAGGLVSIALAVWMLGWFAGGVSIGMSALNHSLHPGEKGQEFIRTVSSGPWYQFPYLLWMVSPLTFLLGALGLAAALFPTKFFAKLKAPTQAPDLGAAGCAAVLLLGFIAFSSFVPGMQNLRYICPADGAWCLLAGLGIWYAVAFARGRLSGTAYRAAVVAAVLVATAGAVRDYNTFTSVVVASGMEDIPSLWLRLHLER